MTEDLSSTEEMLNQNDDFGNTLLHEAAISGNIHNAHLLIYNGCDLNPLNHMNYTPLMMALEYNHFKIARLLLYEGASPFILTPQFESALNIAIEKVFLCCNA